MKVLANTRIQFIGSQDLLFSSFVCGPYLSFIIPSFTFTCTVIISTFSFSMSRTITPKISTSESINNVAPKENKFYPLIQSLILDFLSSKLIQQGSIVIPHIYDIFRVTIVYYFKFYFICYFYNYFQQKACAQTYIYLYVSYYIYFLYI